MLWSNSFSLIIDNTWVTILFPHHSASVTHICISELSNHCLIYFSWWLVPCFTPSYYLNQCWLAINWTPSNKPLWSFNQNTIIFSLKNAFENVVCKILAILFRPKCVDTRGTTRVSLGGCFKNAFELSNLNSLEILYKIALSMYEQDILCEISKVLFEIPHKKHQPILSKMCI